MTEGYYYAAREYSGHAARYNLIKMLSCRMLYEEDAIDWMEFCKSEEPKCKKEFFVFFKKEPWSDNHRSIMRRRNETL